MKKGFTLAEAVLTMTILGVLAAVMITTLKPQQYRAQAYRTLKEKAYASIDEVTQTLISDCTINFTLAAIYNDCSNKAVKTNHAFGTAETQTFMKYMRGSANQCAAMTVDGVSYVATSNIKLKNGVCLYFNTYNVGVDVNGSEGPNDGTDRFSIKINQTNGIDSDMP